MKTATRDRIEKPYMQVRVWKNEQNRWEWNYTYRNQTAQSKGHGFLEYYDDLGDLFFMVDNYHSHGTEVDLYFDVGDISEIERELKNY